MVSTSAVWKHCSLHVSFVPARWQLLRVNAKPVNITFVQVYAPTGASSEEEITSFYEQLQGVLYTVRRKDVIVIMGDWNANIGKSVHKSDNIGAYGLGDRNERGDLLEDFCVANELVVTILLFNSIREDCIPGQVRETECGIKLTTS